MTTNALVLEARRLGEPSPGEGWRRLLWQMADQMDRLTSDRDQLVLALDAVIYAWKAHARVCDLEWSVEDPWLEEAETILSRVKGHQESPGT